jgi:sulfofructose kinase
LPAYAVRAVDTTGAGDVFHGAYALAIAGGCGVPDALRLASATAALKCRQRGGRDGIPELRSVLEFLALNPEP